MENLLNLNGKTAIVTGASSGIGKGIAQYLAKAGANITLAARRLEKLQELAKEIESNGQKTLPIKVDVTQKEDIQKMVAETIKHFGKVDILVNNAGILEYKNFLEVDEKNWNDVLNVNLRGYLWAGQEAAKEMAKNKSGKIINIASIAGFAAFPQITVYNISKAGVIMLTKSMAAELGPVGINVNAIAPGLIETEMTQDILKDPKTAEGFLAKIPVGRTGKPEDIAGVAAFLASDLSNYVSGETIVVDGGWICHL
ncbi:MAG: 3-oxoacyl-ACP reductase FabG [Candidatus Berkelbacteria bacterium]|nr:3-oxoacyl-ACP reductase FabG [Candidatus Berkelbacteria bacterium]